MVESHIHRVSGNQHKKGLEVGAYWKTEGVVRRMVLRHHRRGSAFCQHVGRTFFPALHVPVLEFEPEFEPSWVISMVADSAYRLFRSMFKQRPIDSSCQTFAMSASSYTE